MKGGRQLFTCPACAKRFFYWVPEATSQPKVKCYFCSAETFPSGEPPAPPPPAPPPPQPRQPPTPQSRLPPPKELLHLRPEEKREQRAREIVAPRGAVSGRRGPVDDLPADDGHEIGRAHV